MLFINSAELFVRYLFVLVGFYRFPPLTHGELLPLASGKPLTLSSVAAKEVWD